MMYGNLYQIHFKIHKNNKKGEHYNEENGGIINTNQFIHQLLLMERESGEEDNKS